MHKVISVLPKDNYVLHLEFDDGVSGDISIKDRLFGSMFEPLKDVGFFNQVSIDSFGSICWPNDADLDTDVLYYKVAPEKKSREEHIKLMSDNFATPPEFN
jgi:hypothetical protein